MQKKGGNLGESDWSLGQNTENKTLAKQFHCTEEGDSFISKEKWMTTLCCCRESEVSRGTGGRRGYRAEVLKELPSTAGRRGGGSDEADGLIGTGCPVGKRCSQGSPIALASLLVRPGPSLGLPTSLSQLEGRRCLWGNETVYGQSAPSNEDSSKPLSTAIWQQSVHHLFVSGILHCDPDCFLQF